MLPDLSALSVPTGMDGGSPPPARRLHDDEDKENLPRSAAGNAVELVDYDETNEQHQERWEELAQRGRATMAEFNAAADANVGLLLANRIDITFASNGGKILGVVDAPAGIIDASPSAPNAQTLDSLIVMVVGCFVAYLNRGARFELSEDGAMRIALPAAEWGLRDATAWLNADKMGDLFQVLIDFGNSWSV